MGKWENVLEIIKRKDYLKQAVEICGGNALEDRESDHLMEAVRCGRLVEETCIRLKEEEDRNYFIHFMVLLYLGSLASLT